MRGEDHPDRSTTPANSFDVHLADGGPRTFTTSMLLEMEALQAGFRTTRRGAKLLTAEKDGKTISWHGPTPHLTTGEAEHICRLKPRTREVLEAAGLPVPPGRHLRQDQLHEARHLARELGYPVVLKPADGIKGRGVTSGIASDEELDLAIKVLRESEYAESGCLIERHVSGHDYRFLATPARVLSVVRRDPASVTGDGRSTITQLVDAKNTFRQMHNPHLGRPRNVIKLDEVTDAVLAKQGLTRDSVPAAGRWVQLSPAANLSRGGDSTEVMDETHPSLLELATAAVAAVPGLAYGGVDIIAADHRVPVGDQPVHIIEINHNPALLMHPFPMYGPPRNAARELVLECARAEGVATRKPADRLTVRSEVRGLVQGVGYRAWLARRARALALDGWVRNDPDDRRRVTLVCHGHPERVARLIKDAVKGPKAADPTEVTTVRIDDVPPPGFHIQKEQARRQPGRRVWRRLTARWG